MFEQFLENFKLTNRYENKTTEQVLLPSIFSKAIGAAEFLYKFEGSTFNNGLYRLHQIVEIEKWTLIVESAFPYFKGRINCFAYDWLGRQFTLDSNRVSEGEPLLLMFDVGAGEALEISVSFNDFHNLIVDYPKDALASHLFSEWKTTVVHEVQLHECVGYKIPLFLNGKEELSNLEVSSMKVYWELIGQILQQVRKLPAGSQISKIEIRD
ncbi:hypothetical protein PQG02_31690 (plasmid) [Nostoc sp. UHCC 0926]|uniref:T6SS immunity protein Tdi1 domain-containing protein n=1 Tax=Nostoc sp. UHCC 0926 TaxID=3025190 RepID=UPI0023619D64|nr:T6SS immunity protein Tdi1 domain-containing protein [Nostoc sp. UHCC 0926]WDD35970.1 hypothetical protein PQG02_31690 [Nostoc sp. UHCC 0926]